MPVFWGEFIPQVSVATALARLISIWHAANGQSARTQINVGYKDSSHTGETGPGNSRMQTFPHMDSWEKQRCPSRVL